MRYFLILFLTLLTTNSASAEKIKFSQISLPTPKYAENIATGDNLRFFNKYKTFKFNNIQPDEIREFYNSHFISLGWEDPNKDLTEESNSVPEGEDFKKREWDGQTWRTNSSNAPEVLLEKALFLTFVAIWAVIYLHLAIFRQHVWVAAVVFSLLSICTGTAVVEMLATDASFTATLWVSGGLQLYISAVDLTGLVHHASGTTRESSPYATTVLICSILILLPAAIVDCSQNFL